MHLLLQVRLSRQGKHLPTLVKNSMPINSARISLDKMIQRHASSCHCALKAPSYSRKSAFKNIVTWCGILEIRYYIKPTTDMMKIWSNVLAPLPKNNVIIIFYAPCVPAAKQRDVRSREHDRSQVVTHTHNEVTVAANVCTSAGLSGTNIYYEWR